MKSMKFFTAILLFSTLFLSCSNSDTDEELQILINNQKTFAEDTGTYPVPPTPPVDPEKK
jgi:hypothetical protein